MTDYGHDLLFGTALAPDASDPRSLVSVVEASEELGLDLVGVQDHPYQPAFLDTWTLLSYLAASTARIRLFPDVANVPLRPPAVLARAAASLDILSGGRLELGLGAGYFLDPIAAMGGPRRTMSEHVEALEEAIQVMRSLWTPGPPVHFHGSYYSLEGARPGPEPPHRIAIWLGAYKGRMLRLTGRLADGWIPSLGYAGPEQLAAMNRTIDEAARAAGRQPAEIRRGFNVNGSFGSPGSGFLKGPPGEWVEQLATLALEDGTSTFILGSAPESMESLRRFAEEVVPALREEVDRRRRAARPAGGGGHAVSSGDGRPGASAEGPVLEAARETERLVASEERVSAAGRAGQQTLLAIHQHLRQELWKLVDVMTQVAEGQTSAAEARSYLNQMTMRQNYWTLGAFCAAYCRVVSVHHAIEDQHMFADLEAADRSLASVLERLREDHERIAAVLAEVDSALVAMIDGGDRLDGARGAVERLGELLLAHLQDEENQLLEPIGRLAIPI
jgi:Luciferase-like monooxygenase/Hemerythrin HHE cation binding domain